MRMSSEEKTLKSSQTPMKVMERKEIDMDLSLTAVELGKKIKNKDISVVEAVSAYLDSMEAIKNYLR